MDGFDLAVEQYHAGLVKFVTGRSEPVRQIFSQREDVVLCNPFRPFARGPREVADTLEQAASHFADGEIAFERVSTIRSPELGYILEVEKFSATLDGSEGSGSLRVTTLFRPEEDGWKIVHRHADPITRPQMIGSILQK